jgi:class 3 adenylate cyclase
MGEYCLSGPGTTPHVVVQQILAAGESREIAAQLAPGPYRLRTLEPGGECDFEYPGEAFPELIAEECAMTIGPQQSSGVISCVNRRNRRTTFVIESRRWAEDALTAYHVTLLQGFRDLFSDQVLRPGDEVGIEQITLLFTDLKGSTALYDRIGDLNAFALVQQHFGRLQEATVRHNGAIIKTIGDAVMAAFLKPADAVQAALEMRKEIASFNERQPDKALILKIGVHKGAAIAVTLNDRLDYFGQTVNIAARVQNLADADEIFVSQDVYEATGVRDELAGYSVESKSAQLRGVRQELPVFRVGAAATAA